MESIIYSPKLDRSVHLTRERIEHLQSEHPDLSPAFDTLILETIKEPDQIRPSKRLEGAYLLSKWFPDVLNGKHVVVVVVTHPVRSWVATAYLTSKLST